MAPDADKVRAALRAKYGGGAWAFFEEVGNATGLKCNRHAVAVAMSLWPSRGLHLYGFEIKVSRSDWLAELRNPEKADDVAKYCDFWSLVVGDAAIVKPGELPETWGLFALKNETVECSKEPRKLDAAPLDRSFIAALLGQQRQRRHSSPPPSTGASSVDRSRVRVTTGSRK